MKYRPYISNIPFSPPLASRIYARAFPLRPARFCVGVARTPTRTGACPSGHLCDPRAAEAAGIASRREETVDRGRILGFSERRDGLAHLGVFLGGEEHVIHDAGDKV